MSDDFKLTPAVAHAIRDSQFFTLVSSTLYLYDLLLTLDLEVELLWPSKWNLIKIIYLFQRYLPLIDMVIITILWQFSNVPNLHTCRILANGASWAYCIGITLSEILLTWRTIAVWGNTTTIRVGLFVFSAGCIAPLFWMLAKKGLIYHSIPITGLYCFAGGGPHIKFLCWVLLTVYDTGLLILIATRAFQGYKASRAIHQSTLSTVVYQDVALSAINVILTLKLPGSSVALLVTSIQRVAYSILTSRVMLHIREQTARTQVVMTL
ncbi:hypothetical protein BDN72DRAFT_902127 [Pluteus cervinus]|uniref:Uncharacterized protein n=1 Tax=Pluteus cervinus TaxID=181527 RepID=A0ACD3ADW0_9AGAR|nr:hypothetical protein BDN72DRAFT_902127 [Pluteus cervinus]